MIFKKVVSVVLACTFFVQPVLAQEGLLGDFRTPLQASEYIYRSSPKESLISVHLLGAVQKPGIYYVPAQTDLLKLLTLAGGATSVGDLSEILVRKTEVQGWNQIQSKAISEHRGAYEVDVKKFIQYGGSKQLILAQDDFVYVPQSEPFISAEVSRTVTIFSVVLGMALTGLLIDKNSN